MRNTIFLFLSLPLFSFGQVDTAAINRQSDSLGRIVDTLIRKGDFEEAWRINALDEKIILESIGEESKAFGNICMDYGRISHYRGDYSEAEQWYLKARAAYKKTLGGGHLKYGNALNNLAILYTDLGQYEKAKPVFLESEDVLEQAVGKDHPDYAQSISNFATLYLKMGEYDKAEWLYLEGKDIRERVLGKDHRDYAQSISNLAVLYYNLDKLEKAEPLLLESKDIRERLLGQRHPEYALSLLNLAVLYSEMGRYAKAESWYLKCKDIQEQIFEKNHPGYALTLLDLAVLYDYLGQYEKAELFYLECKNIQKQSMGEDNPEYAHSLFNLAELYFKMGKSRQAEALHLDCRDIRGRVLGREHPDYASSLISLAKLYAHLGQYSKSEQLYLESKGILRRALGENNRNYAAALNGLAGLYMDQGRYEEAERFYLESKDIRERVLGKEHPDYASALSSLANLYHILQRYEESEAYFAEAAGLQQSRLSRSVSFLSERELSDYTRLFRRDGGKMLNFALESGLNKLGNSQLASFCFDNALFYKGFLLTASGQLANLAKSHPESKELDEELKSYRRRLAREYAKTSQERDSAIVAELEDKANAIEKALAKQVSGYAQVIRPVNCKEVQSALKKGEAAVEFVHFGIDFPKKTDSIAYAALLLLPDSASPHFIPLFEEKQLQALFREHPKEKVAYLNQLYGNKENGDNLYQLIWQPLDSLLAGTQTIYASPSGLLHRINLGTIMVDGQLAVADQYQLSIVGSTRQLVVQGNPPFAVRDSLITATLYGGIRYDYDSTAMAQSVPIQADTTGLLSGSELSFNYLERSVPERGRSWDYLPGTAREADEIQALIERQEGKTETLQGYQATEESFKKLGKDAPSPRILHLATHGYFYPDPAGRRNTSPLGEPVPNLIREGWEGAGAPFKISDHPMIRSGLILAGGNQAWRGKPVPEGLEDGILTAYEVSQVDLRNTELVVLSACETGLGDIEGNEGVYGLQRAFKIAGADKLIMSLWNVPDAQTQEMMVLFYRYWLEEGMALSEAFRAAQGEMRKRYKDHYYWGAFVLIE
ncbi:MAG: CHAT domain-containing protein [Lewinellaceae bacterium]|nr:CHAT domain-containing protein [Lewinellaceae bacterium]